jgi:hypothetical protein
VLKGLEDGSTPRRSSTTLGDFLDDWLIVQKQRIRPTTWHGYEVAVERIKRHLGKAKLQALSPLQIERFYSTLLESGRSGGGALAAKRYATRTSCFARRWPTQSGWNSCTEMPLVPLKRRRSNDLSTSFARPMS